VLFDILPKLLLGGFSVRIAQRRVGHALITFERKLGVDTDGSGGFGKKENAVGAQAVIEGVLQ